jgi:peptide/nickel transport system permease protein
MDGLLSFPALVLAIFMVSILGPALINAIIAISIVFIPSFVRITRINTLSLSKQDFVVSAHMLGATNRQIIMRHILPNVLSPILVQITLGMSRAILTEASLSFLGLGVQRPTPSWGNMIADGRQFIVQAPWMITFPGLAIFLTVLSFNFLGDGLREALDPRRRNAP